MTEYEKIMNYIENEITSGYIKQGQKLPSIRDISEKFKCSKVTVTKSYDLLEKKHIIYSVPQSGHYVIASQLNKNDKLYTKDILIGDMSRYYLKDYTNNKFIRVSISGVNNDNIKSGISVLLSEIKD